MKLDLSDLKIWLHKNLGRDDKLLLLLAHFEEPVQVGDLRNAGLEAGFKIPDSWNASQILSRTSGLAIRVPKGWELTDPGRAHLLTLGVTKASPTAVKIATDLRTHLGKISDSTTKSFVEEAIRCFESELYRSAIVMSWMAAVDILYKKISSKHLAAFNAEAAKCDTKWKMAKNADDIGKMKERDFLDRIAAISVVGKNVKQELIKALELRNGCGHPNSLKIGPNAVAHHIEILLLNVFEPFCK